MADVGDIVRAVVTYQSPGASIQQNVFWWIIEEMGIGNPALLAEISDWVSVDWGLLWAEVASDQVNLVDVSVDLMNPDGTVKVNVGIDVINLPGDGASTVLPAATSGYLLAQTALPKSRGSKYIPGMDENSLDEGVFTLIAVVLLLSMAVIYVAPVTTTVGAVLRAGVLTRLTQEFNEFLLEASTTDVPAYQRRRKPGVGS